MENQTMINLPGYQILARIYESANSLVYRGRRQEDNQPVIVKVLKQEYPTEEQVQRYQQEYDIIRQLNLDEIVRAYDLQQYQNQWVMILEDFGGESLRILMESQELTLVGFLTLAIKVIKNLGSIHAKNIIHKDINPANIVLNPVTGQVKIIDFTIATTVNHEITPTKKSALEGTFAYISPEQTGRINSLIDYRTDFYSLGVTLYELLTKTLPFDATDPMELIHCHLAKEPIPPHAKKPEIPEIISDIILKLLAKSPEDRYQSAWGLQADLENCLTQLQETGKIVKFKLGTEDISDRFKIPEKLYGRDQDIADLIAAFKRVSNGAKEMILVAGYSGIGKSALIREIYQPVVQLGGYFISGKFDQFQRGTPYSAVVSAFSELVSLLLSQSEEFLEKWRGKIMAALGNNAQIIIDVIPEIEFIIGPQPAVPVLKPAEAQNRFNLVFQNFIHLFCAKDHPLVIFLDDLQWADSASLKLIKLMMSDDRTKYLCLIGAYRDNEVNSTHPLMMTIDMLRHEQAIVSRYYLSPLNLEQITQFIADTLHKPAELVESLAELVLRKTQGNPFFVAEFLKTLYQEKLLNFEPLYSNNKNGWQWNIREIEAVGITDNVVELMIQKLQKLPEDTQQVLRLGACLGNQFDLNTISLIHGKEAVGTFRDLWPAIKEELIQPISDLQFTQEQLFNFPLLVLNYQFLHDRVQQAAYALIDDSQKKAVHLQIGRMFLMNTPVEYRIDRAFELVDHLNVGRELVTESEEKLELATLNLAAAKKAKDATAYQAAKDYLTAGVDLLPENSWDAYYNLTFALYRNLAEIEYLTGNFAASEKYINQTLAKAKSVTEKAEVYNLLVVQYSLQAKYQQAVDAGIAALKLLGVELPQENFPEAIAAEFAAAKKQWENRQITSILHDPEMASPDKKLALKVLTNLGAPTYLTNLQLWTIIFVRGVNISLAYGSTPESCICLTNYGIMLVSVFGDYQSAYQFGQLAMGLIDKWNARDLKCKATAGLANSVLYWFNHIKESNFMNHEAYQAALECGDLEYAGYALHNTACNAFFQGKNLNQLLAEVPRYLELTKKTQNQLSTDLLEGLDLCLWNLAQLTPEFLSFATNELNEADYLAACEAHQNLYAVCIYYIRKLQIFYLYGELNAAFDCAKSIEPFLPYVQGLLPMADYTFYAAMTWVGLYGKFSDREQPEYLEKLQSALANLKLWQDNCAENFQHQYLLLAAEMSRINGKFMEAIAAYDSAIKSAQENEFIQHQALANELAAKFWLNQGYKKYAQSHLIEAYYAYQRWGAKRKVEQLEQTYPQLPSLTQVDNPFSPLVTTATFASGSRGSGILDLASVIKAYQAISSEIVLDKLLANLMKILIENAGAQKGCLILRSSAEGNPESQGSQVKFAIAAEAAITETGAIVENSAATLAQMRRISDDILPIAVINYVERTRSDVVLSNAVKDGRFTTDNYISERQIKSLLCTPIVNAGQLLGILYLENNLTSGAFTPDRLEVLRLLSSQAAISLENALLYASVEQKVWERTQELNEKNLHLKQTLTELKKTQAHLVQSEKMSSLGQLVAGVAHEINNPVNFIYGNLNPAREYVEDLLNLISLYEEHYPHPVSEIADEIEAMDLEFLREDLQKILTSMKIGAERIRQIVLSLRNFSRLDEAEMKPVDIHEGIESTLMILRPLLKGKPGSFDEIQVVKEYGQLPKVSCYPSQLNQVFMNVLSNACDALKMNRIDNQADYIPTIRIYTEVNESNSVVIRIADNGSGMDNQIVKKIFDPFFTTKPVGSGTGLGLSISYQIIVEAHRGKINCFSTVGKGTEFIIEIPIAQKKTM
jgi:predicted ATPase/signal transduction histidine kinase/tRNA A-37 threonylcarbamoyl transferase component Bud32